MLVRPGVLLRRSRVRCTLAGCFLLLVGGNAAAEEASGGKAARYHQALQSRGLGSQLSLSAQWLEDMLERAHQWAMEGQRDRAIAALSRITQHAEFERFRALPVGRATLLLLARLFAESGAQAAAVELLQGMAVPASESQHSGVVPQLVSLALTSPRPEQFRETIESLAAGAPAAAGEVAYYRARLLERAGSVPEALAEYSKVVPRSPHWAQAQYRIGLLSVQNGDLRRGEQAFCRVAAPQQTPAMAPLYGGGDFFTVRDLARVALGRVAHEDFRFDDASYYYHLVPADSPLLPEALYEAATSAYEARHYRRARLLLDQLKGVDSLHQYTDEALILEAYVELAGCHFREAEALLVTFLKRYQGVAQALERLSQHPKLIEGLVSNRQARPAEQAFTPEVQELLVALLRTDPGYQQASMRLAQLRHQLRALAMTADMARDAKDHVRDGRTVVARPASTSLQTRLDRLNGLSRGMMSVQRELMSLESLGLSERKIGGVRGELEALREEVGIFDPRRAERARSSEGDSTPLLSLLQSDEAEARELGQAGHELEREVLQRRMELAQAALVRLQRRLTRLARQAQAARIETVLGTKRNLELEIEALSDGLLPAGAVDSLEAARFLGDDEEFWPFDGEDWSDEYVGGEGL